MCAPQPPSNLSPLACQSQKKTNTSTSNPTEKTPPAVSKGRWKQTFSFPPFPWCIRLFCSLKAQVLSALYCYICMKKNLYNPNTAESWKCFCQTPDIIIHILHYWNLKLSFPKVHWIEVMLWPATCLCTVSLFGKILSITEIKYNLFNLHFTFLEQWLI